MEEDRNREAPAGRVLLLTALTALAVVAAVAFGRVFRGSGTSLRLALAAALAILLAGAFERRHVLLATVASILALAVTIGLMVFPHTTGYGFPTTATFAAATQALRSVVHTASVEVAPALPLTPLLLAGLTAVWAAAFAAHTLAVRAASPFLAMVPPASLLAFAGIVLGEGARPLYVLAFLVASLAVLFADGLRRVRRWGPVSAWQGRRGPRLGSAGTLRGARRVGIACLAIAAFTPWILPGFGSAPLLRLKGDAAPLRVSIDPIVDIRPALLRNPAVRLFTVRSEKPSYWRFLPLDRFDGRRWRASNIEARGGVTVSTSGLPSPDAPVHSFRLRQVFTLNRLAQPWLPAAFDPAYVALDEGTARFDARSDVLFAEQGTHPGFSYSVTSNAIVPPPRELDEVKELSTPEAAPFTQLPDNTPAEILSIARKLTRREPTPYRKIIAIQQFLRRFQYDEAAEPGHGVNDILHFLTHTQRGYCEQFAGSMAVLLRALGIPARVALGFTPGALDREAGVYSVTTQNAHTWVEVLFPRYGWLSFEPTPVRENPVAQPYAAPAFTQPPAETESCTRYGGQDCQKEGSRGGNALDPERFRQRERVADPGAAGVRDRAQRDAAPSGRPWLALVWKVGLMALAAAALAIPLGKAAARRLSLVRAREPRDRVLAAYHVLAGQASDVGLGRRAPESLAEYAGRLGQRVRLSDGHLDRLIALARRAAYSADAISESEGEQALESSRGVASEIRRSVGAVKWAMGRFRVDTRPFA